MECLDLSYQLPEENLACDEALLNLCDSGEIGESLRFWESPKPFVVVGYGNDIHKEVNVEACATANIPIFRRCSGGGTVLQGHGCLNYALVLRINRNVTLESITGTNCYIMSKQRDAIRALGFDVEISGFTDLVLNSNPPMKFSGNAQRRRRQAVLFHGTFLYAFDLPLIEQFLRMPTHQPEYRAARSHTAFVTNLRSSLAEIKHALRQMWEANESMAANYTPMVQSLAAERYASAAWNRRM